MEAIRTQAMPAIVIRTAPATQPHPVTATPARAIRAIAIVADLIVLKVNRPARKATANRRVSQIRKIPAATVSLSRVIRGRVTRNPATPVAADLIPQAIPVRAKAQANQATRRANLKVIQTRKANHPVVSARVTAKATAFHGQPVTQRVVQQVTRKATRQWFGKRIRQYLVSIHERLARSVNQRVGPSKRKPLRQRTTKRTSSIRKQHERTMQFNLDLVMRLATPRK